MTERGINIFSETFKKYFAWNGAPCSRKGILTRGGDVYAGQSSFYSLKRLYRMAYTHFNNTAGVEISDDFFRQKCLSISTVGGRGNKAGIRHCFFKNTINNQQFNRKPMATLKERGASKGTANRGFASMDEKQQREIARKGGEAVSRNRQHMAQIGRKGGEAVSQNREHMAEIGRKGGETVSRDRDHMAQIGRKGGETVSQNRDHMAEIGRKGGEAVSEDRQHMADIGRKGGENGGQHGENQEADNT